MLRLSTFCRSDKFHQGLSWRAHMGRDTEGLCGLSWRVYLGRDTEGLWGLSWQVYMGRDAEGL